MTRLHPAIIALCLHSFLILFCLGSYAQTSNWIWAKSAGGERDDIGTAIALDGSGNSYITGGFNSNSISFGSTTLTNASAPPAVDILVAKYNPSGNLLWAKSAGGTGHDFAYGIAVDGSGNSYITGDFESSNISFGSTTLTKAGTWDGDIFVSKYDSSGNVLWAKSAGGTYWDRGYGIAVDGSGNILVTGYFASVSISFGSTVLTNASGTSREIFIVKYDPAGNVLWARSAGGNESDVGTGVAVDGGGNSYVTGSFTSSSISFGSTTLTNAGTSGSPDVFVVKYDALGNVLWAKSAGGTGADGSGSIVVDGSGNVCVVGGFESSAINFGSTTLTKSGTGDLFVVKYDPSGSVLWAKSTGGKNDVAGTGIALDVSGNIYISGTFSDSSISFGSTTLTNAGTSGEFDVFIAKYDPSGNVIWATSGGGTGNQFSEGIAVDGNGYSYLAGYYQDSSCILGGTTLPNAGGYDVFIAKLEPSPNGISEVKAAIGWQAYPNPVKDILYLRSNNNKPLSGMAQIYDYTGRKVLEKTIDGKQAEIDMQHLSAGVYLLRAGTEGVKVVKE